MKGLKVIPEILIWLAFTVITGFGYAFSFLGYLESRALVTAANIVIPTLVWLLLAVICTLLLRVAHNSSCFIQLSGKEGLFLELSVFLLLLVGGFVFRFADYFQTVWPAEADNTYFLYAMVSQENGAYMNPHPISRIYVLFLHVICMFFGNHYTAGAYAQFILMLVAVLFWYFAIRKSLGKITALFFVAGAMLLPDSITASIQCDPMILLFVFYGFLAWFCVQYVYNDHRGMLMYLHVFLLGVLVILALVFDVSGVLAVLAYLLLLRYKDKRDALNGVVHRFTVFWELLGMLTGGFIFRYVQSAIYGMSFALSGSFNCYQGLTVHFPDLERLKEFIFRLGVHPVFIVAIVVISVYWFLENKTTTSWIMLGIIYLFGLQLLGLDYYLNHDFIIYIGIILLLGIAAGQFLDIRKDTAEINMQAQDVNSNTELDFKEPVVQMINFDEQPAVVIEEKERPLIYIPKTMEIPKRVSKPKVDFAVEVEEAKMHFDIPVEENSDFDIE